MKIKTLSISNFRNLSSGVYDLYDRTAFEGRNHIGKTNLVEAVYWLLTDSLVGGSSDVSSIKPLTDTKAIVSVEAVFDNGFKFRKDYYENWVKTRGGDEVTLKGHSTDYYVNGLKITTAKEAIGKLYEELGLEGITIKTGKVDLVKILVNPLYASEQLEWKTLRSLIVELVGDINDEDVIKSDSRFEGLRDTLQRFNGDTSYALKSYKQAVSTLNEKCLQIKGSIDFLKTKNAVDPIKLTDAKSKLASIEKKIADLKVGTASAQFEDDLQKMKMSINDKFNAEQSAYSAIQSEKSKKLADLRSKEDYLANRVSVQKTEKTSIEALKSAVARDEEDCRNAKITLDSIGSDEWKKTYEVICPNCHCVLNQEKIDSEKTRQSGIWINELNSRNKKLDEDKKTLEELEGNLDIFDYTNDLKKLEEEKKESLNIRFETFTPSNDLQKMKTDYNLLLEKYRAAKNDDEAMFSARKQELIASESEFKEIIDQDMNYAFSLRDIVSQEASLKECQKDITKNEQLQMLLTDFIAKRLELLNSNVSKVFGDIKFVLAESNIKAGSWNEVCYPLIVGKDTKFEFGSSSEKIRTGYLILEKIKAAIHAPDLPIIFDECEKFDSLNLAETFTTKSQIITAKVSDNYVLPTVVEIK